MKKRALLALIIFAYFFLALDAFNVSSPLDSIPIFDSRLMMILAPLFGFASIKFFGSKQNSLFWQVHNYLLLPMLMIIAAIFLGLELYHYNTYVQEIFGFNISRIVYLPLAAGMTFLVTRPKIFYQRHWRRLIFITPGVLFVIAALIYVRNNFIFRWLVAEDSIVEYAQFLLLMGSAVLASLSAKIWFVKNKLISFILLMAAFLLALVAAEEISWGQRLLSFDTPAEFAARNTQGELTLHNIDSVFGYVYRGYMIIGLVGSLLWTVKTRLMKFFGGQIAVLLEIATPDWYLFFYFFTAFAYNFDRFYLRLRKGETLWEEPMELLLILGIFLFFLIQYFSCSRFTNKLQARQSS